MKELLVLIKIRQKRSSTVTSLLNQSLTSNNTRIKFLTNNKVATAFKATASKFATAYEWHQMLVHASIEVIQHLESSTRGVKISNQDNEGKVLSANLVAKQ